MLTEDEAPFSFSIAFLSREIIFVVQGRVFLTVYINAMAPEPISSTSNRADMLVRGGLGLKSLQCKWARQA